MSTTHPIPAVRLTAFKRECDLLAVRNGTPFAVLCNNTEDVLARFGSAVDAARWAMQWTGPTSICDVR